MGPEPQHFEYFSMRSDFLWLAQTSVYLVDCTSAVNNLPFYRPSGMNRSEQDKFQLLCCEASIPGSGSATHESTGDFAGVTEKMVYRRIFDDTLDLTFYVDAKYQVPEFLESWHAYCLGEDPVGEFDRRSRVLDNSYYRMNYPDDYKRDIFLTKFDKNINAKPGSGLPAEQIPGGSNPIFGLPDQTQPKMNYTFLRAFPSSIASIPISYNASDILKITVSFTYTRYIKED